MAIDSLESTEIDWMANDRNYLICSKKELTDVRREGNNSPRHLLMRLVVEIWDNLNCKNSNYYDKYIVDAVIAAVEVVVDVMEAGLHFVVVDGYGHF